MQLSSDSTQHNTWRFRHSSLPAAVRRRCTRSHSSITPQLQSLQEVMMPSLSVQAILDYFCLSATLIWTFGFHLIYAFIVHPVLYFWLLDWFMACCCKFLLFFMLNHTFFPDSLHLLSIGIHFSSVGCLCQQKFN